MGFGKKLIHKRSTIHKDRNRKKHLAKRYRKEAHRRFKTALEQKNYEDALKMLYEMENWLRGINESAADSLFKAIEEVLTLHRLKIPGILRQRWFASVLLYSERRFKKICLNS